MEKGIGSRIKKARKAAGLDQSDVAKFVGVSINTVSKWELDKAFPTPGDHLNKLAEVLNQTKVYLAMGLSFDESDEEIESTLTNKMKFLTPNELEVVERFVDFLIEEKNNKLKNGNQNGSD